MPVSVVSPERTGLNSFSSNCPLTPLRYRTLPLDQGKAALLQMAEENNKSFPVVLVDTLSDCLDLLSNQLIEIPDTWHLKLLHGLSNSVFYKIRLIAFL